MGESEGDKGISETGQKRQTENERRSQSQTVSQNENRLGQEKGQKVQITGGLGNGGFPSKETQIKSNRPGRGVPANDPITRFEVCPRIGFFVLMEVGPDFRSCRLRAGTPRRQRRPTSWSSEMARARKPLPDSEALVPPRRRGGCPQRTKQRQSRPTQSA